MPRRTAFLLPLIGVLLAGCGGSSPDDEGAGAPDVGKFSATFTKATGVKLQQDRLSTFTSLRTSDASSYRRFGGFSVYFVKDEEAAKGLLEGGGDVKDYGNDVLVSFSSDQEGTKERLDQAVRAALKGDPSLVPAAERPCATDVGEGRCRLGGKALTVVGPGQELATPVLKAKVVSATVARQLPARSEYSDPVRAKGRFVAVRFTLDNVLNQPISSIQPNLVIGGNTYSESAEAYSLRYANDPFPLQPGDSATVTTAFDVPEAAAADAIGQGQLELPAGVFEGSGSLSDADAIGRLRLEGAKTLALQGGSSSGGGSSSSGSSSSGTSAKAEGRKAAAEDALKEFYRALHRGNVKFVCKRLTRAAQQNFGGASSCSQGRIIKAEAKAKAPSTNVGLRFTTVLTNGQTRAIILVSRRSGGFTDTARLARQGNLWRVQGTRRLAGLG